MASRGDTKDLKHRLVPLMHLLHPELSKVRNMEIYSLSYLEMIHELKILNNTAFGVNSKPSATTFTLSSKVIKSTKT